MGIFAIGQALRWLRYGNSYIRAVNYHATPRHTRENFRRQLEFYRGCFENVTKADLAACLAGRRMARAKPGLVFSLDDGYLSNYEVAAPMLEEHGFTGWFFISSGRTGDGNSLTSAEREPFMTFNDARDLLARGHVIGCHTHTHVRLSEDLSEAQLRDEIVTARTRLEHALGSTVDIFCWVGGEEWSYSVPAARLVAEARYRYAFATNQKVLTAATPPLVLDRTNIESDWPLSRVRFYLSGAMDLAYIGKRRRVGAKLMQGIMAASAAPSVG